jgi:hypothetical protein
MLLATACGSDPVGEAPTDAGVDAPGNRDGDVADIADITELGIEASDDVRTDLREEGATADTSPDAEPLDWVEPELCATTDCGLGECDPISGTCRCDAGAWFDGFTCTPTCADCDECPVIVAPVLHPVVASEMLRFAADGAELELGVQLDIRASEPEEWHPGDVIPLAEFEGMRVRVFARLTDPECAHIQFHRVYDVRDAYPNPAEMLGSDAISNESGQIVGWADEVVNYDPGEELFDEWMDPTRALGPAEGNAVDIVSLGEGGVVTLGFAPPIEDGLGADFLIFENSFSDQFLEFAFVEVSSDGETFVRFDSASLTRDPVDRFGRIDPNGVGALPGRYRQGWGSPHDLGELRQRPEVRTGTLELRRVSHVRLVDVVGDGTSLDSFGRPIYDPTPTQESAGFDLDAIGVLNVEGE